MGGGGEEVDGDLVSLGIEIWKENGFGGGDKGYLEDVEE